MSTTTQCDNCDAWKSLGQGENKKMMGLCCAHPPIPLVLGHEPVPNILRQGPPKSQPVVAAVSPKTSADFWCREWQPKGGFN